MSTYRLEIVVDSIVPGSSVQDYPAYRIYQEAYEAMYNLQVTRGLVIDLQMSVGVVAKSRYENEAWYQELGINQFPAVLIAEVERGVLVSRLEGPQITKSNLLSVFLQLNELSFDPVSGTFVHPDGKPVGGNGVTPGGLGLFSFPWWMILVAGGIAWQTLKK